jgi:hypothetical protein
MEWDEVDGGIKLIERDEGRSWGGKKSRRERGICWRILPRAIESEAVIHQTMKI